MVVLVNMTTHTPYSKSHHIKTEKHHIWRTILLIVASCIMLVGAIVVIYISTITLPDLSAFEQRKIARSTKIYDRTGEILLYDIHKDIRRTVIPFADMGNSIKKTTIAIEDASFYNHKGIRISSLFRALLVDIMSGKTSQGGSTITQQIVKNTLLTQEKTITRKIKEIVLATKLEKMLNKDEILEYYLNEAPYGGNLYGIQEASISFFGKKPIDLTLSEAAYLAAIPQAPTYFSPYGKHIKELDTRKNLVLQKSLENNLITQTEYNDAKLAQVVFLPQEPKGIKAPHFVFFIKEQLVTTYGEDVVENGGLKVITTLDWKLQSQAEEMAKKYALKNEIDWNAKNTALVAIDPKTGQILSMVGSRDYFDKEIEGNFNVATAERQPGSSFKPFVYATSFMKGYTPNTILFDTRTEFNAGCNVYGRAVTTSQDKCYTPDNYDGKYVGPITLRNALAQSRNIPAVKLLYLSGIVDSLKTAKTLGITSLTNANQYGLTLVLGGGEVSLLEMTSAYGVFANDGIRNPTTGILSVVDGDNEKLEEFKDISYQAIDSNIARQVSDILSDNTARAPLFGSRSFFYFGDNASVAGKTGTTNNNKDAWVMGYSPDIAVGVWTGNNDNTPMKKGSAISGPLWNEYMRLAIASLPHTSFIPPIIDDGDELKPVLRGVWQGGETFTIDTISEKLATEFTPAETKKEIWIPNVHDILHWVDKSNPRGPIPENPSKDSQYTHWETSAQNWWNTNKQNYPNVVVVKPTTLDDVHTAQTIPSIDIILSKKTYTPTDTISFKINYSGTYPFKKAEVYIGNTFLGTVYNKNNIVSFPLSTIGSVGDTTVRVVVTDEVFNKKESSESIEIN